MNRFEVLNERLGDGAMGVAKLVRRLVWSYYRELNFNLFVKSDNKKFVVKQIRQSMNPKDKKETDREVEILKTLKDPNIVR